MTRPDQTTKIYKYNIYKEYSNLFYINLGIPFLLFKNKDIKYV